MTTLDTPLEFRVYPRKYVSNSLLEIISPDVMYDRKNTKFITIILFLAFVENADLYNCIILFSTR